VGVFVGLVGVLGREVSVTFTEFWGSDIIPMRYLSYIFLPFSSLTGGWAFALTGSWWKAICTDFWAFLMLWAIALAAHFLIDAAVAVLIRLGFPLTRSAALKF
jgi:hypothetical protein